MTQNDDWVTENGNFKFEKQNIEVPEPSQEELSHAFTKLSFRGNVLLKARKKEKLQPKKDH